MRVEAEGRELYVRVLGEGRPAVVLGGIHLSHDYLRPWLDPLADRVRLAYLDHRGTGRSAPARPGEEDLSGVDHPRWAEDVEEVRRETVADRIFLLGHSYGGFLALEYAVRHPHRLAGVILSNTAPVFDFQEAAMANAAARGGPEQLAALQRLFSGPVGSDGELGELWRAILPLYFHEWDTDAAARMEEDTTYSAAAFNRAYGACLSTYDLRDRLGEVTCPALVLDGAHDWIMPPAHAGARLADGLPDAERVVFERSGHFPFVEERDRFLEVVAGWIRKGEAPEEPADRDGTGAAR